MTRSLRRFWVCYIAAATVYALATVALWAGPLVEGRFFPVRIEQRIHDTWRVDNRLCWAWAAVKVRDLPSTDIDVYLHVDGYAAPSSRPSSARSMSFRGRRQALRRSGPATGDTA